MMRLFKFLFPFLAVSFHLKAQTGFDPEDYTSYFNLENYLTGSREYQEEVDYSCAIFINPTALQLSQMKEAYGEDDFEVIAHDSDYYAGLAENRLDELNIRVLSINSGIIRLVGDRNRNNWYLDTSKEGAPPWNLILFNSYKEPVVYSVVDISDNEIKEYFNVME